MAHEHHEINKDKMKNDIVLTIALIISINLVRFLMHVSGLDANDYDATLFFIFSFICIKVTYNLINKFVDYVIKVSKIRRIRG